jgi:EamA domain-containing membrane protein RarD
MSPRSRLLLAVAAWCLAAVAVMLPLVWLINNRDWGVALMLAVPFVVYGLLRLGRVLEGWARATPPPSGQ